jgi:serine/threonine protein kinase
MPQNRYLIKDGEERFGFVRSIQGGGMGKIILARDRYNGNASVVLKFMKTQHVGHNPEDQAKFEKALERFKREIRIAMELRHPHILQSLGYGYMGQNGYEELYLVFPYIAGGALSGITSNRKQLEWSLEETLDVILQVASGLDYMHTHPKQIVHLDVKPGNVLLQSTQSTKSFVNVLLCDFGIARWQFTSRDKTSTANAIGTEYYMAPEQYRGKLWPTADQFSLAVMACELLTGRRPIYHFDDPERHDEAMRQYRPSLLNRQRVWSSEIDDVLLKALMLDPHKRFPSVAEFAQALQQAVLRQITNQVSGAAIFIPISLNRAVDEEESQETIRSPMPDQQEGIVKPVKPAHKVLPSLQVQPILKKEHLPGRPSSMCWSPDGQYIACTFYGTILPLIFKRSIGEQSEPIQGTSTGQAACWSPDGRILLVSGPGRVEGHSELCFWNRTVPAEWPLTLSFPVRVIQEFDWSKYGQLAVWVGNQIYVYTMRSNQSLSDKQLIHHSVIAQGLVQGKNNAPHSTMRWSPDGSTLAIGTSNGALLCWRADSETLLSQWDTSTSMQRITCLAWSPDSTCLAVAFSNRRVVMWSVYERRILAEWEPSLLPAAPRLLSISHQGQIAVVCSNRTQLFFGTFGASDFFATYPGQWFATWSPTRTEFATLDAASVTTLAVYKAT